jgi:hypothetical protein
LIWAEKALPRHSWKLLHQSVILHKARILCALDQHGRAIENCKRLLALPDLESALHESVMAQFWAPINSNPEQARAAAAKMNTLMDVAWVRLNDRSFPEFWGFDRREFKEMIEEFDRLHKTPRADVQSYEAIWMGGDQEAKEKPRVLRVGTEVRIAIGAKNRYRFALFLEDGQLGAEYNGGETRAENYTIKPIAAVSIPGRTQRPFPIEFFFTPRSEGTFVINSVTLTYWSLVETKMPVGPLSFVALRNWPEVSLTIHGFPDRSECGECHQFSVAIRNVCDEPVPDVALVYDHAMCLIPLRAHTTEGRLYLVKLENGLQKGETVTIEFIYRADRPGDCRFHFFASTAGTRSAFAMARCSVVSTRRIEARLIKKSDATTNGILHCTIRTDLEAVTFSGLFDRTGRLLWTLGLTGTKIARGNALSVIALTEDTTDEVVERWRIEAMGNCSYALLLTAEGRALRAQHNIDVAATFDGRQFKIAMDPSFLAGQPIRCRLIGPENQPTCFVRPLPICIAGSQHPAILARWIGTSTRCLSTANGFRGHFTISAPLGIFEINGFLMSDDPTFEHPVELPVRHVFRVVESA